MLVLNHSRWFEARQEHGVVVVRFTRRRISDQEPVRQIQEDLIELVRELYRPRLLLDFSRVGYVSTYMLSVLKALARELKEAGGRLALCGLGPEIRQVFEVTLLTTVLPTYAGEREAIDSFRRRTGLSEEPGRRDEP